MTENSSQVDLFKKVSLTIQAGTSPDAMNIIPDPFPYEFIFGLAVEGLSPLEQKLSQKKMGEEVMVDLNPKQLHFTLHHHRLPDCTAPDDSSTVYLKIRIDQVAKADQREIIKGLANQTSCHDCDCGCGGH